MTRTTKILPLAGRAAAILAALLVAACSADEPHAADTAPHAVGFTATVAATAQPPSRAAGEYTGKGMLTTEGLHAVGFGVYAWYTGTVNFDEWATHTHIKDYLGTSGFMLMRNQKVEWDDATATWGYTPTKYWPSDPDEKVTYRAYAPYVDYELLTLPTDGTATDRGTPYLPVVVHADDYCSNRQQDPLWGTSRHDDIPLRTDDAVYGKHYDNFTYRMSGDELTPDARDGAIDWYFHHGMAMLGLMASVPGTQPAGTEVKITAIHVGPFYDQGLLDVFNSPTTSATDKPIWHDRTGDIYVDLAYQHLNDPADPVQGTHNDLLDFNLKRGIDENVAENGLLMIPRDYSTGDGLQIQVTYTITVGDGAPTTQTATATLKQNIHGNTIYLLHMLLNAESNTLYLEAFVNHDWQYGAYKRLDDL